MLAFLICISHYLQFKKLLIENSTGYNFWVFNNLQCKRDREKSKNKIIAKITRYLVCKIMMIKKFWTLVL